MNENLKHWVLFWITVILILGFLLVTVVYMVERVEKHTGAWQEQIEKKQTQEMDSLKLNKSVRSVASQF